MHSIIWPAISCPVVDSMPSRPGDELISSTLGPEADNFRGLDGDFALLGGDFNFGGRAA